MENEMRNSHKTVSTNVILMLFFVLFLMLFVGKMDVHAGTLDANGYTVATDLSGNAYTLLTDDNVLYIFRTADSLSVGDTYTYTKDGKSYTGTIKNANFETSFTRITLGGTATKVVFLDDIQYTGTAIGFTSTTLTSIEGVKEHLDTSKATNMYQMFYLG